MELLELVIGRRFPSHTIDKWSCDYSRNPMYLTTRVPAEISVGRVYSLVLINLSMQDLNTLARYFQVGQMVKNVPLRYTDNEYIYLNGCISHIERRYDESILLQVIPSNELLVEVGNGTAS